MKPDNFLKDANNNIWIIGFDIPQSQGIVTSSINQGYTVYGLNKGYASPEIIRFYERQQAKTLLIVENVSPFSAYAYSWGIMGLELFEKLKNNMIFKIDNNKNSQEENDKKFEIIINTISINDN